MIKTKNWRLLILISAPAMLLAGSLVAALVRSHDVGKMSGRMESMQDELDERAPLIPLVHETKDRVDDHERRIQKLEAGDLVRAVEAACGPRPEGTFAFGAGTETDPYRWETLASIIAIGEMIGGD